MTPTHRCARCSSEITVQTFVARPGTQIYFEIPGGALDMSILQSQVSLAGRSPSLAKSRAARSTVRCWRNPVERSLSSGNVRPASASYRRRPFDGTGEVSR